MKTQTTSRTYWQQWLSKFIGLENEDNEPMGSLHYPEDEGNKPPLRSFVYTVLLCALVTTLTFALRALLAPENLLLIYLIAVAGVAARLGQRPAILASVLSVIAFDFFLVPPYYSLSVEDTQYLLTFAIMLAVSLAISTMTAYLRHLARVAHYRARRTNALFELSRDLQGALTHEQVAQVVQKRLNGMFQAEIGLYLPDAQGVLHLLEAHAISPAFKAKASKRSVQHAYEMQNAGHSFQLNEPPDHAQENWQEPHYFPLLAPMRNRGVLVILPENHRQFVYPEQQRMAHICASQIALAVERIHYVEVARENEVAMKAEQLRNSLLNALSHDVRTPLAAIIGISSTLANRRLFLSEEGHDELIDALQEEALRMNGLVLNLLDMAKLQSGSVRLNKHWQFIEDVIGSSLELLKRTLGDRVIEVALPDNLPLLEFDAVLIERVLSNLLSNVVKYTPPHSACKILAAQLGDEVQIAIADTGPGLPENMEEAIFDKFTRGAQESSHSGIGLGLSICRTIVEAHGGRIWAENVPDGGARFIFTIPVGTPPSEQELGSHESIV